MTHPPTPVILDTDIGSDIDDTWALAMLLKSPELDAKLITSATGNTHYRASLIAKFLERSNRLDIPLGIGPGREMDANRYAQRKWIEDYRLEDYPGILHTDGVQAMIDTIMASPTPVTLIAIGPVTNVAEALRREPSIAAKTTFVGMQGSFHIHHKTNHHLAIGEGPIPEFNVACDIPAAQTVFSTQWRRAVITPLDSCGMIVLDGERYQQVRHSTDAMLRDVIENYDIWSPWDETNDPNTHSSVLFDVIAIHLAFTTRGLRMETHPVVVDDDGFTKIDAVGRPFEIGMGWTDLDGFMDGFVERLLKSEG